MKNWLYLGFLGLIAVLFAASLYEGFSVNKEISRLPANSADPIVTIPVGNTQ